MRANVFADGSGKSPTMTMPKPLVRAYRVEGVKADGERVTVFREENNLRQCGNVPTDAAFTELALIPESLWGGEGYGEGGAHVLSFDAR